MAKSLHIYVQGVFITTIQTNTIRIPIICTSDSKPIPTTALIDSGAGEEFINYFFVLKHWLNLHQLHKPLPVFNMDGTPNHRGTITHYILLPIHLPNQTFRTHQLLVTLLGKEPIILGFTWLKQINPDIDWQMGRVTIDPTKERSLTASICRLLAKCITNKKEDNIT